VCLSEEDRAAVKDFELLFAATKAEGLPLPEAVRRHAPVVTVSRQVSFLTDVCVPVKLGHLKPTTTFRFLLWMDLGFVACLKQLLIHYGILSTEDVFHLPIPRDDLACDPGVGSWAPALHDMTTERYLHTDPVEGCLGHESSACLLPSTLDPLSPDLTHASQGEAGIALVEHPQCCVCGAALEVSRADADARMTMLL
jgi:hypothetical protein